MNSSVRLWLAAVLALLATAVIVSSALAHGKSVRCEPFDGQTLAEAPSEALLCFDEDIDGKFSTFRFEGKEGQPIEVSDIHVDPDDDTLLVGSLPDLAAGVYKITWKVLTPDDGHVTSGTIVFRVGDGPPPPLTPDADAPETIPLLEVLLKWLSFGLMAALVGSVAVVHLVLKVKDKAPATDEALCEARQRTLKWAAWAGAAALLVGLGLTLLQARSLADGSLEQALTEGVWWDLLTESRPGILWLVRWGAILGLIVSVTLMRRGVGITAITMVVLAPALMASQALTSHAASLSENSLLAVVVDTLHLIAASVWVGGLFILIVALRPLIWRGGSPPTALVRTALRRFGTLAALSVGVLIVTGLYSAGRQVASPDALLTTVFGRALIGKTGLILAAGAVGLLNTALLHPRLAAPLAHLLRRPKGWTPVSMQRLPTLLMAEAAFGLLILLMAGLITSVAPARGPEFQRPADAVAPSFLSQPVDDLVLTLAVRPNKPGDNIFEVGILNTRRPPPAEIEGVSLRITSREGQVDALQADPVEGSPGQYRLAGSYLEQSGPWQVEVVARRQGLSDTIVRFDWTVPPIVPEAPDRSVLLSNRSLESPLTAAAVIGASAIALLALAAWVVGRRSTGPKILRGARGEGGAPGAVEEAT